MKEERLCKKCGRKIPYTIFIDGKKKCLKNRKFCLTCSPFGINNKVSDNSEGYKKWSREKKDIHIARVLKKKYERKKKLVEMAGGKCIRCGYDKNLRALSFHHREPENKKFEINIQTLSKSWDSIMEEFNKCDLLCLNCHAEVESEKNTDWRNYDNIIKNGIENGIIRGKTSKHSFCKCCGKEFTPKYKKVKYCSSECRKTSFKVVNRPSKEELQDMLKTLSYSTIGEKYGVSGNAIKKWAKRYEIHIEK